MTDKERLEEIKNSHLRGIHSLFGTPWVSMPKDNFEWLIKQAERVEELEDKCNYLSDMNEMLVDLNGVLPDEPELYIKLKKENRRYREALELLVKQETLGKDVKTGKTAISYNGMIALKGLGIFNDNNYIVYGADEVIENVLEGRE